MGWIVKRLNSLAGTIVATMVGLFAIQIPALVDAYLQRLGGHIAEARRHVSAIATDPLYATLEDSAHHTLSVQAAQRLADLTTAQDTIAGADVLSRSFVFIRRLDGEIARATLDAFTPILPLDSAALAHGLAGLVLGWILYEILTWPLRALWAQPSARSHTTQRQG